MVLATPPAVLPRRDSAEAVSQRGQVFVDFVRPNGGVSPVLEQTVEVEAAGGTSAASARSVLALVGCAVEVVGNPCHDIVDEFTAVSARPGPRVLMPGGCLEIGDELMNCCQSYRDRGMGMLLGW